jgi:hypothetical protein
MRFRVRDLAPVSRRRAAIRHRSSEDVQRRAVILPAEVI